MPASAEYLDHLKDLLSDLGPVTARRMFGGAGLFLDGLMFGLIADDTLYLKVDDRNRPDYDALDLPPFTYSKNGKDFAMSYCLAPADILEDPHDLVAWTRKAFEAALASQKGKRGKKASGKK